MNIYFLILSYHRIAATKCYFDAIMLVPSEIIARQPEFLRPHIFYSAKERRVDVLRRLLHIAEERHSIDSTFVHDILTFTSVSKERTSEIVYEKTPLYWAVQNDDP
jgi:DNA polymerase III psi subunit